MKKCYVMRKSRAMAVKRRCDEDLLAPLAKVSLRKPGLFITATDTGVGKTVVTCAIAHALKRSGLKVSVCKPLASGCRREREGLVSEDAEAIAYFSDCRLALDVINPIRFAAPLSPGAAALELGVEVDFSELARSLSRLDEWGDVMLVEGVGGLLVPLGAHQPDLTVLDLIAALGYPVVVVTRAGLGTLNHTAMTAALLRQRKLRVAGMVVNGYVTDQATQRDDPSMASNRQWLERMTRLPVLATVPRCDGEQVRPELGRIAEDVLEAVAMTHWPEVLRAPER